jgi:hypothetical protein
MRHPTKRTTTGTTIKNAFITFIAFPVIMVTNVMAAAAAVVDAEIGVVIRTYDTPDVVSDLSPALAAAAAILEDAGVGVTWLNCEVAFVLRDGNPCLAPLTANELAIRFVRRRPHPAEDVVTLGDSLIDTRLRAGSLATIYVNLVATLAGRCGVDVQTLLARAVAHEIGHLLLGTSAHASSGLMRAAWSRGSLRRGRIEDWTFTVRDAHSMREAVRTRNARRTAAGKVGE